MLQIWKKSVGDDEKGFTLVEILVVIGIIGILTAIAVPLFLNQRKEANAAALRSDLRNAAASVEIHFEANPMDTDVDFFEIPDFKASTDTRYALRGTANTWCIIGIHNNSKYNSFSNVNTALTYDSVNGGLMRDGWNWHTQSQCETATTNWDWKSG